MPELPEVETTRRQIAPLVVGFRIERVETTSRSYFFLTSPVKLRRGLVGRRIERLDRAGKYLVAGLDDGARLLLHLGMTGQLFSSRSASPRLLSSTARSTLSPEAVRVFEPDEHTHLRLTMQGSGPQIYFRDVRKFGKVQLIGPGEASPRLDRLGPAKEVAQLAATIGRSFRHELLAAASPQRETEIAEALDKLVNASLVYRQGTGGQATYEFKHALVRDAAYGSLLKQTRQAHHRRVV